MCIICVKKSGVKLPKEQVLRDCFINNPDGAGVAFTHTGGRVVHLRKGFMKADDLLKALEEYKLSKADEIVYHFRQATHGLKDAGNCHPFPLSAKIEDLRAVALDVPVAVAHNGIFGSMPDHNILSDTQKFVAKILSNPAIVANVENKAIQELIKGYCGTSSKLAFIRPGGVVVVGKFEKNKGLLFSNDGFRVPRFISYGGLSGYGYSHGGRWASADDSDEQDWSEKWRKDYKPSHSCDYCGTYSDVSFDASNSCYLCPGCRDVFNRDSGRVLKDE
jgi:hypothetical protein